MATITSAGTPASGFPNPGSPVAIPRPFYGWAVHDGMVTTRRFLLQTWRVPELIFFGLIQPVVFLLLFAYVFGGSINVGGPGSASFYREFLVPGVLVQNLAFSVVGPTVGIAEDMKRGIIDRFRSLPMAPSAVLSGRTVADLLRSAMLVIVVMIVGLLIGWRVNNGFWDWLLAFGLMLLFAYSLSWVGSLIGLYMPSPEVANTAGLIWVFPLTFISSAFVSPATMPAWMQPIAIWNPVSTVAQSCRQLFGNPTGVLGTSFPEQHPGWISFFWCLGLLAVFVPLAVAKFKRSQSG
jgi:ABC-2 type transport system permease protein